MRLKLRRVLIQMKQHEPRIRIRFEFQFRVPQPLSLPDSLPRSASQSTSQWIQYCCWLAGWLPGCLAGEPKVSKPNQTNRSAAKWRGRGTTATKNTLKRFKGFRIAQYCGYIAMGTAIDIGIWIGVQSCSCFYNDFRLWNSQVEFQWKICVIY